MNVFLLSFLVMFYTLCTYTINFKFYFFNNVSRSYHIVSFEKFLVSLSLYRIRYHQASFHCCTKILFYFFFSINSNMFKVILRFVVRFRHESIFIDQ